MVLKPEPLAAAVADAKTRLPSAKVLLLAANGQPLTQKTARTLSTASELILVCGRYEGVDQRFIEKYIDQEISIGDYILMGGEVPAMVLIETVARLLPGVIGNLGSTTSESFENNLLEAPQYTRPPSFEGQQVPPVLLSGDHQAIDKWRLESSQKTTLERRPDLLNKPME